jgi:hypothetical protein
MFILFETKILVRLEPLVLQRLRAGFTERLDILAASFARQAGLETVRVAGLNYCCVPSPGECMNVSIALS